MPGRIRPVRATTTTPNTKLIRLEKSLADARAATEKRVKVLERYLGVNGARILENARLERARAQASEDRMRAKMHAAAREAAENQARAKARQEKVDDFFARAQAAQDRARAKERQEQVDAFFARAQAAQDRARAQVDPRIEKINKAFNDARVAIQNATSLANMKRALLKGRVKIHPNKHGGFNHATKRTKNLVQFFDEQSKRFDAR
jgi:hypothetical protein